MSSFFIQLLSAERVAMTSLSKAFEFLFGLVVRCEESDEIMTVSKFTSGCEDRDLDSWLPRTEISILTVDELLLLSPSLEAIVTSSDGLL